MRKKMTAMLLALAMLITMGIQSFAEVETASPAISAEDFASPARQYQPGERWWWPGGCVDADELIREIDEMAENNIGYVEINPFGKHVVELEGYEGRKTAIYTDEFWALVDVAVTEAEAKGIIVDLNMGTAWNANSQFVTYEESMDNMALGRAVVSGGTAETIPVPAIEKSPLYDGAGVVWNPDAAVLQGVLVALKTADGAALTSANALTGSDGEAITYEARWILDPEQSVFIDAADLADGGFLLADTGLRVDAAAEYAVIALYAIPSGGQGVNDAATDWFVVNHLNKEMCADYINDWLGVEAVQAMLAKHGNIRAVFNDSYEIFRQDLFYDREIYTLAKDVENNGLGYDFSKYLPTVYKLQSLGFRGSSAPTFISFTEDADVEARILYDYNTLVSQKFLEGMEGFESAANAMGLLYRQEAYNPPIDTLASAKYVDIPEVEQGKEMSLIRGASGAHLYERNLVTCEQYTLGCSPLSNTLAMVKIGYDIMATSGVNNFVYHGYGYHYGVGSEEYGENGWAPFYDIGINATNMNTLSAYWPQMNLYAGRVNFMMQSGDISRDAALYMPFNGSLSETDAVKAMNYNGIAWDAINDASILAEDTVYEDGRIVVNGGNVVYQAIVVESESVPVATMEKLAELARQGATIIFAAAPSRQPSYADGNYAELDTRVKEITTELTSGRSPLATLASGLSAIESALLSKVSPSVSYNRNENVRFLRRRLEDGCELVYIRNLNDTANTITVNAKGYGNYYWLDQNDGRIYAADSYNGTLTFTLDGASDVYSSQHSVAIALLCAPKGVAYPEEVLSEGLPASLTQGAYDAIVELKVDSLTVTADNFDGVMGEEETRVFTVDVIGNWIDPAFQDGALQTVVSDGVYATSYNKAGDEKRVVLLLNDVNTAASVTVNGVEAGCLLFAPYELDITDYLVDGENAIEITVTPRKKNRYYNNPNGQYTNVTTLQDAGMAGLVYVGVTYPSALELAQEALETAQAALAAVEALNAK